MLSPIETNILNQALARLEAETGLSWQWDKRTTAKEGADALIKIQEQALAAEIKRNVRPAHIGAIMQRLKVRQPWLLIADYLSPQIAKTLKENGIQYMDACGNVYINLPPLFVHIAGNKPAHEQLKKVAINKAFDATGLKAIYGFLCNEGLINASYREISQQTGIALGAVGGILRGLVEAGHLIDPDKSSDRQLVNRRRLLDRWVEAYPEKLRPKLHLGKFVGSDPAWWEKFSVTEYEALWGSEVAASKCVFSLKPQIATVYLPEVARNKLIAAAKLKKAARQNDSQPGTVDIYQSFWSGKSNNPSVPDCVHPILIYADLIATADSRNLEAARKLYETMLVKYFGEN